MTLHAYGKAVAGLKLLEPGWQCYNAGMTKLAKIPQKLSAKELARRQHAAARAEASLRLEGLAPSLAVREISAKWQRGEITDEEMAAQIDALPESRG